MASLIPPAVLPGVEVSPENHGPLVEDKMSAKLCEELAKEIRLFIRYAVPEEDFDKAVQLVEKYRDDLLILRLLREHYSVLPGDLEERVEQVYSLASKQGVYLIVVSSVSCPFLYLVSMDEVVCLGEYGRKVAPEVLEYFEYAGQQEFLKDCRSVGQLKEFHKTRVAKKPRCPVCQVVEGELHLLGCVVEVCPWCGGQLTSCNCSFDQLETEEIKDEEQLREFHELLTARGRVPFSRDQVPSYPGTSDGLDVEDR